MSPRASRATSRASACSPGPKGHPLPHLPPIESRVRTAPPRRPRSRARARPAAGPALNLNGDLVPTSGGLSLDSATARKVFSSVVSVLSRPSRVRSSRSSVLRRGSGPAAGLALARLLGRRGGAVRTLLSIGGRCGRGWPLGPGEQAEALDVALEALGDIAGQQLLDRGAGPDFDVGLVLTRHGWPVRGLLRRLRRSRRGRGWLGRTSSGRVLVRVRTASGFQEHPRGGRGVLGPHRPVSGREPPSRPTATTNRNRVRDAQVTRPVRHASERLDKTARLLRRALALAGANRLNRRESRQSLPDPVQKTTASL